jgi:hypothetical protein
MRLMIDECVAALDRAHKEVAANYTYIRKSLFEFLTVYAYFEPKLARFALCLHIILADSAASKQLETLLGQGRALIDEATAHAQGMLLNLVKGPVVDVVSLSRPGHDGGVRLRRWSSLADAAPAHCSGRWCRPWAVDAP